MPTIRHRRARNWAASLDEYRRRDLLEGNVGLLAGVGYGADLSTGGRLWTDQQWASVTAEMLADWRKHGTDLTISFAAEFPGRRPWAWWQFDAPAPRKKGEGEAAYLKHLKLLLPGETDRLSQHPAEVVR